MSTIPEATVKTHHQCGGARVSVMKSGLYVISAHSEYVTTFAVGKGLDVGLHMTETPARELLTVLQEALA